MSVRLELLENDGNYVGVAYTRGFYKNESYGCDYVLSGRMYNGEISLVKKDVRLAVNMLKSECEIFEALYIVFSAKNNGAQLRAKWFWGNGAFDSFVAVKTDSVVSETAKDEIDSYVKDLYKQFEENNVILEPEDRLHRKVAALEVDSSDIMLSFSSINKNLHDSITVMYNGNIIAQARSLSKQPLVIHLKKPESGINDLVVISNSVVQNKLSLRLLVKQQQKEYTYTIEPGFTQNSLLLLNRKQN